MTVTDVALYQAQHEVNRPQTAVEIRAAVNRIQEVMREVMKPNVHYGVIPGTQKPTLYKPGAEKLAMTFRLAVEPEVTDLSSPDEIRYRVAARIVSQISGVVLGTGIGECSSSEEKYRWRGVSCQKEWDATPEDRRRLKYNRRNEETRQIRTNPCDVANTILKMAKKRALVDGILTVTAASDVFDQDIEDLPEEIVQAQAAATNEPDDPELEQKIEQGFAMLGIKEDEQKKLRAEFAPKALRTHLVQMWRDKQAAKDREPGQEG